MLLEILSDFWSSTGFAIMEYGQRIIALGLVAFAIELHLELLWEK